MLNFISQKKEEVVPRLYKIGRLNYHSSPKCFDENWGCLWFFFPSSTFVHKISCNVIMYIPGLGTLQIDGTPNWKKFEKQILQGIMYWENLLPTLRQTTLFQSALQISWLTLVMDSIEASLKQSEFSKLPLWKVFRFAWFCQIMSIVHKYKQLRIRENSRSVFV